MINLPEVPLSIGDIIVEDRRRRGESVIIQTQPTLRTAQIGRTNDDALILGISYEVHMPVSVVGHVAIDVLAEGIGPDGSPLTDLLSWFQEQQALGPTLHTKSV